MFLFISKKEKKNLLSKNCQNNEIKYLFHGTHIIPISYILTKGYLYSKKPFFGFGIYFSDMLDYISFYNGGKNFGGVEQNYGKIIPIDYTFSSVGTIVFYDKDKIKYVDNIYVMN